MKKSDKKYRRFDVQRNYQFETHDADGNQISDITENEWCNKVTSEIRSLFENSNITEVFYIFHDSDINDDGTSKGLHVHLVVTFKEAHTQTAVVKLLLASSVHNCTPCDSYVDSLRYLIHVSETALNEMKHIYSVNDVHGWKLDEDGNVISVTVQDFKEAMSRKNTKKSRKEQKKVKDSCVIAVMSGDSIISDVRCVYENDTCNVGLTSSDYIKDKYIYREASVEWLERITEFYQDHACPLTSIYISGGGGTGKTSLANAIARKFADSHGIHQVASPGRNTTFDFAGNYRGERVSIFNEFSSAFPVEQFLSIFDPLNAMPVNSRNSDKLYFANYSIFTTSVPLEMFIYNLWLPYAKQNSKIPVNVRNNLIKAGVGEFQWLNAYQQYLPQNDDKILQIRRRIPIQIQIEKGFATILVLDKHFNSRDSFAFCQPAPGKSPYTKYSTLVYDVNDPDSIGNQTTALVDAIVKSIDYYYSMNGYKHPDSFEKPDFSR
ncbi:MAG: replication protein [Ruminococcus sp.]|nr:replication protein [Ruminococcus sp.]